MFEFSYKRVRRVNQRLPKNKSNKKSRSVVARLAVVFALGAVLTTQVKAGPPLVTLPGMLGVTASGAATYSVPIVVPPGTAGMAPHISLDYNSDNGNGLLGLGWSLSGFPAITRCPRTTAQDGVVGSVNYDTNDRYCFEGQRLIRISGTYGGDGALYGTEIDSFAKITSHGTTTGGPQYWIVRTKTGQIIELGNTSNSRSLAVGTSKVRTWQVNKISDRIGNYLTVTYTNDTTNGQIYPSRVDYTANDTEELETYNSVQFTYSTSRADAAPTYHAGSLLKTTALLTNVKTYTGVTLVSDYQITYEAGTSTARSRITSIRMCDGSSNCLPATTFGWQGTRDSISYSTVSAPATGEPPMSTGDFNGDGLTDAFFTAVYGEVGYNYKILFGNQSHGLDNPSTGYQVNYTGVLDYNGDGYTDMLIYNGGSSPSYSGATNNHSGGFTTGTLSSFPTSAGHLVVAIGDYDSDGRLDSIGMGPATTYAKTTRTWNGSSAGPVPNGNNHLIITGDFDGNGCSDSITDDFGYSPTRTLYYSCNAAVSSYSVPFDFHGSGDMFGDFNGDGKTDILLDNGSNTAVIRLSTGTGFVAQSSFSMPTNWKNSSTYQTVIGDWNSDGKADLALVNKAKASHIILLSTGTSLTQVATMTNAAAGVSTLYGVEVSVGDWNNDGLPDIWLYQDTSSGYLENVYRIAFTPEKLTTVTTGLGAVSTITYDRLNKNGTFYTRDTDATYPVKDLDGPIYVVSQLDNSDGIGGTYSTTYAYKGLKVHQGGRGFLGFRQRIVTDQETGIVTTTNYLQTFPYIGLVSSETKVKSSVTLSSVTNEYCDDTTDCEGTSGTGIYFPHLTESVQDANDLNGAALPTVTTTFGDESITGYDAYGNVTKVTVTKGDGYAVTTNTYSNDATNWVLGSLTDATMSHYLSGASTITRHSSFEYEAVTGLLTEERIEGTAGDGPYEVATNYAYDAFGNKTSATVSGTSITSRTTSTSYDAVGRFATGATNALSQSESRAFSAGLGALTSHTDVNNLTTSMTYDGFGRPTLETRPDSNKTSFAYGYCSGVAGGSASCPTYGAFVVTVTPYASNGSTKNGPYKKTYFDHLGRVIAEDTEGFSGSNVRIATQYDGLGRPQQQSRPYFTSGGTAEWTINTYDVLGRVTETEFPDGSEATFGYNGLTSTVTNDLGQVTTKVLNDEGELDHVTDDLSNSTYYTYDAVGNLKTITDAAGNVTTYTYDVRGRKTAVNDRDMGSSSYSYNVLSQVTSQTDAKSNTTTFSYDLLGRMTEQNVSGLVSKWTFGTSSANHNVGKLTESKACTTSGCSTVITKQNYTYDSYGRPSTTTIAEGGTNYVYTSTYTSNGQVDTITYPSTFVAKYVYNSLGYVTNLKDNGTSATLWTANTLDAELRLTQETAGNSVVTYRSFDPETGTVDTIQAGPSYSVANFSYEFDTIGNLISRVDSYNSVTEHFCYDDLNRLTNYAVGASCTASGYKTVAYNAIGNITSKTGVGTYTYPSSGASSTRPHAVSSITGTLNGVTNPTFTYDSNGNMTAGAGRTITYTNYDMTSQITQGALTINFTYDAARARVKMTDGTATTIYLNDPASGSKSEKYTTGGNTTWRDYLTVGGRMIGERFKTSSTTTWAYFVQDHLGSITAITDGSGTVIDRLSYDPWGKRRNIDGTDATGPITSSTTRGFTGEEAIDAVGLVNLNARLYDPELGRFLAADPIVVPEIPQTLNRYTYVNNNPLSLTDTSGLSWLGDLWKGAKKIAKVVLVTVVTIVAATVVVPAVLGAVGAAVGAAGLGSSVIANTAIVGAASGAIRTGTLEGALIGGVTGAASSFAGDFIGGLDLSETSALVANVGSQGVVGGLSSVASGGDFASGFLSAGVGAYTGLAEGLGGDGTRMLVASLGGGAAAVLGGGKFEDGALSAAYGYLGSALGGTMVSAAQGQVGCFAFNCPKQTLRVDWELAFTDAAAADAYALKDVQYLTRRSGSKWEYASGTVQVDDLYYPIVPITSKNAFGVRLANPTSFTSQYDVRTYVHSHVTTPYNIPALFSQGDRDVGDIFRTDSSFQGFYSTHGTVVRKDIGLPGSETAGYEGYNCDGRLC